MNDHQQGLVKMDGKYHFYKKNVSGSPMYYYYTSLKPFYVKFYFLYTVYLW